MTNFNFDALETDSEIEWPQRGRRTKPLPEQLVNALHQSFSNGSTPAMTVPTSKKNTFVNLLNKAGRELNYRIEKVVQDGVPEEGYTTFHFRTRHRRTNK